MKKDNGFIFIITLLMITVIILLVLASMQHILLFYKIINRQEESHKNFYNMENTARQLVQKNLTSFTPICIIREDSPNHLLHQVIHQQGCSLVSEGLKYGYLIEDLGEFSCLVARIKNQKYATHHRRLTIVQLDKGNPLSFLQVRLITAAGPANCVAKEHIIPVGISSWRYLSSIQSQ